MALVQWCCGLFVFFDGAGGHRKFCIKTRVSHTIASTNTGSAPGIQSGDSTFNAFRLKKAR